MESFRATDMHHIFFVHSHLTFLTAREYIEEFSIHQDDVLFILCSRYPELPAGHQKYKSLIFPEDFHLAGSSRILDRINFFRTIRNLRTVERLVNDCVNHGPFSLYLINTCSDIHSVLVTMKNCVGYRLIEEGSSSYLRKSEFPPLFGKISLFFIENFLQKVPFFQRFFLLKDSYISTNSNKFIGTVSLSDTAFPDTHGERTIVKLPFHSESLDFTPDLIFSVDLSLLLVFKDKFPDKLIEYLGNYITAKNYQRVAYKLHPVIATQQPQIADLFRQAIAKYFPQSTVELEQGCVLENILYNSKSAFLSDYSSIGIYAHIFGCSCISYSSAILHLYPDVDYYNDRLTKLPCILLNSYRDIETVQ